MLELRDYQADVLDRSAAAVERGVLRQLWVLATGLGKTVIFCALIARRGGRALVLAHRDTLIAQAVAKLLESSDDYRLTAAATKALRALERDDLLAKAADATGPVVGIVQADADDIDADVVVASVQTLSQPHRLDRLVDPEPTLLGVPDRGDVPAEIFSRLADARLNVDMIIQSPAMTEGAANMVFTVGRRDAAAAEKLMREAQAQIGFKDIRVDTDVAKVSVIGVGMRSHAGVAGTMFRALADRGIALQAISTSEIKISVLIAAEYTELAVRALHAAYGLDKL